MEKALEALHAAAKAIEAVDGVYFVTVNNDATSGEIFFWTGGLTEFKLVLREVNND